MGALLKRLESEYQMVLVDTPPMVSLADGAVLAAQVGGSVMVVNASTTRLRRGGDGAGQFGNGRRQNDGLHLGWCKLTLIKPLLPLPKTLPQSIPNR